MRHIGRMLWAIVRFATNTPPIWASVVLLGAFIALIVDNCMHAGGNGLISAHLRLYLFCFIGAPYVIWYKLSALSKRYRKGRKHADGLIWSYLLAFVAHLLLVSVYLGLYLRSWRPDMSLYKADPVAAGLLVVAVLVWGYADYLILARIDLIVDDAKDMAKAVWRHEARAKELFDDEQRSRSKSGNCADGGRTGQRLPPAR
jgi:hypothetical protein